MYADGLRSATAARGKPPTTVFSSHQCMNSSVCGRHSDTLLVIVRLSTWTLNRRQEHIQRLGAYEPTQRAANQTIRICREQSRERPNSRERSVPSESNGPSSEDILPGSILGVVRNRTTINRLSYQIAAALTNDGVIFPEALVDNPPRGRPAQPNDNWVASSSPSTCRARPAQSSALVCVRVE